MYVEYELRRAFAEEDLPFILWLERKAPCVLEISTIRVAPAFEIVCTVAFAHSTVELDWYTCSPFTTKTPFCISERIKLLFVVYATILAVAVKSVYVTVLAYMVLSVLYSVAFDCRLPEMTETYKLPVVVSIVETLIETIWPYPESELLA